MTGLCMNLCTFTSKTILSYDCVYFDGLLHLLFACHVTLPS